MNDQATNLFEWTLQRIRRVWRVPGMRRDGLADLSPELPDGDAERLKRQIDECLDERGGETSVRARSAELAKALCELNATGRKRFLEILARDYDLDRDGVDAAVAELRAAADETARRKAEAALRRALVAPRLRLLPQFNSLEEGVKFLVDLRAELLDSAHSPRLAALDDDFRTLFANWFDVGFLELKRITWDTPAALLEKLIEYEAVHQIQSWGDLKNRLDSDRRCYAFFHPRMPAEPLIFVEVALVAGMADNIHKLLDQRAPAEDPGNADTAVFYSISICQAGLAGVNLGNFLIKRVVGDLAHDLPNVKTFATLSPIPGFRDWLERHLDDPDLLSDAEAGSILAAANGENPAQALKALLDRPGWPGDPDTADALRPALLRLAARYLLNERRGDRAHDRVAHFHLTNGARVERINWLGDTSNSGLRQAAGMMVNYRYKLDEIEKNHESYSGSGHVTAAPAVEKMLKS